MAVLSDSAKINPLFAPLAVPPCENDFLTTRTQFHACPPPLNYPQAGILHKIFLVHGGLAFQREIISAIFVVIFNACVLYFVSNSFAGFTGVEA